MLSIHWSMLLLSSEVHPHKSLHCIYSVLLMFLEVPPTYIHISCILCCFYPGNTHLCCSHPRSTHSSIHMHTLRKCSAPTLGVNTKNICHQPILFPSSNKAPVTSLNTLYWYSSIKRLGCSLKKKRKEEEKEDKCPKKKKWAAQVLSKVYRVPNKGGIYS